MKGQKVLGLKRDKRDEGQIERTEDNRRAERDSRTEGEKDKDTRTEGQSKKDIKVEGQKDRETKKEQNVAWSLIGLVQP